MYSVKKINFWNLFALGKIVGILYRCGKDMTKKYDLQHWNNSRLKNWIIVAMCVVKNEIYLVFDEKSAVATFQVRKTKDALLFSKLATSPDFAGRGIGTFCMEKIEQMARECGSASVICEVYDKSNHAISFYERKGYAVYGTVETLKYTELKMIKTL